MKTEVIKKKMEEKTLAGERLISIDKEDIIIIIMCQKWETREEGDET